MNIIISPAKKMNPEWNSGIEIGLPPLIEDTRTIKNAVSCLTKEELKHLFGANDSITELNYRRFQEMDIHTVENESR